MIALRGWCAALATSLLLIGCGQGHETIEPWPFAVDKVTLSCEPVGTTTKAVKVFVTTGEGKRYAVNGPARADAPLMRDIQKEIDLRPLIERGIALCDGPARSVVLLAPLTPRRSENPGPPQHLLEPDPLNKQGIIATAESDTVVGGSRATLSFACEPDAPPMVLFNFSQGPHTPPPLRGVFGDFEFGGQTLRAEMSWESEGRWTLRSGDSRALDRRFVAAAFNAGGATFRGESQYLPEGPILWTLAGFGDDLARIRDLCS